MAVLFNGKIYALAAERADRIKHSGDARQALNLLCSELNIDPNRSDIDNYFDPSYQPHQAINHHLAHAASTYYPSPFCDAAILVLDGMGPANTGTTCSTSIWHARHNNLKLLETIEEKGTCYRSVGHFYSAITFYLGFEYFDSAHTMALSAYGDPDRFSKEFEAIIWPIQGGLYDVDRDFVYLATYLGMGKELPLDEHTTSIDELLARYSAILGPPRKPTEVILQRHKDIAAAAQKAYERVLWHILTRIAKTINTSNLCLAGGVALNCVANGKVLKNSKFENLFIQPAAADDGQSLGKLMYRMYQQHDLPREWAQTNTYLGPHYSERNVETALHKQSTHLDWYALDSNTLYATVASLIADGEVIAWFQGRSEFGPRALGHRSILADPTSDETFEKISMLVKKRAWFRPFAPTILERDANRYFSTNEPSPFMLKAVTATELGRNKLRAVVHVDNTSRLQTVSSDQSKIKSLLLACEHRLGVPAVLNTSFNLPGEPIVETPADAIKTFLSSKLDYLVLGNKIVTKK